MGHGKISKIQELKEIAGMLKANIESHHPTILKNSISKIDADIRKLQEKRIIAERRLSKSGEVIERDSKRLEKIKTEIKTLELEAAGFNRVARDLSTLNTLRAELKKQGLDIDDFIATGKSQRI